MTLRPVIIGASALLAGLVTAVVGQPFLLTAHLHQETRHMNMHLEGRSDAKEDLFLDVAAAHHSALSLFQRYWSQLTPDTAAVLYDQFFLPHDSGARRSGPDHFDGHFSATDDLVTYGMGAFMGDASPEPARQRALVAGYLAVRQSGPAQMGWFDNLYFNDARNNLIIFGPEREDRLSYYRQHAPADMDFSNEMFVRIALPEENPLGRTRCTHLTDRIDRESERQLTIGCHTPARINGVHLGAFGVTLDIRDYLVHALDHPLPGAENMIIDRQGGLVAHRALFEHSVITDADVAAVRANIDVQHITDTVFGHGAAQGVVLTEDRMGLIGFYSLDAPDWVFVAYRPLPHTHRESWLTALIVGFGVAMVIGLLGGLLTDPRRRA